MPKPRKSVEVLKKQGTFRKHRHEGRDAPKPPPVNGVPVGPDWLTDSQRAIFDRKAAELVEVGVLTTLDIDMLGMYCRLYELIQTSSEVNSAMFGQLRSLANDLGLTPAARERLTVKKPEKAANEFDGI